MGHRIVCPIDLPPFTEAMLMLSSAMSFLPLNNAGWTLPFPSLTLHALTPSTDDSPAHIYCQVDESQVQTNGNMDDEEEYTPMREIRLYLPEGKCMSSKES